MECCWRRSKPNQKYSGRALGLSESGTVCLPSLSHLPLSPRGVAALFGFPRARLALAVLRAMALLELFFFLALIGLVM